jgi:hypothetical protein
MLADPDLPLIAAVCTADDLPRIGAGTHDAA